MTAKRKSYNTTLRADLTRRLRILAAQQGKRHNDTTFWKKLFKTF
jgi:hypothetical protein